MTPEEIRTVLLRCHPDRAAGNVPPILWPGCTYRLRSGEAFVAPVDAPQGAGKAHGESVLFKEGRVDYVVTHERLLEMAIAAKKADRGAGAVCARVHVAPAAMVTAAAIANGAEVRCAVPVAGEDGTVKPTPVVATLPVGATLPCAVVVPRGGGGGKNLRLTVAHAPTPPYAAEGRWGHTHRGVVTAAAVPVPGTHDLRVTTAVAAESEVLWGAVRIVPHQFVAEGGWGVEHVVTRPLAAAAGGGWGGIGGGAALPGSTHVFPGLGRPGAAGGGRGDLIVVFTSEQPKR